MKKILFLLPIFLLVSCNSSQLNTSLNSLKNDGDATETDKTQRYEFSLTKDNLWYFIDSSPSDNGNNSYKTLYYTFQGVLSYAYYENVIIHLDYDIVGMGEPGSYMYPTTTHKADIEFKLNASGSGILSLPYDYVPSNAVPAISETTLYGFERTLTIKSVSGIVRFAI